MSLSFSAPLPALVGPLLALLLWLAGPLALAQALQPAPEHGPTAVDIVEKLESRHYSRRSLDRELSSELLDQYLDRLDGNRMLFLQEDIDEFEAFRHRLDSSLKAGDLAPAFAIFNRYRERTVARLEQLLERLPELLAGFDFDADERMALDRSTAAWPRDQAEADELWRKQVKNRVLGLKLADQPEDRHLDSLSKSYRGQLGRVQQTNAEDVFQLYMNTLTELYDPHTNYLSPRVSENFNINMSLKLEGIGAVLQMEDEHTKVVRLVPAGPADKQGELHPADRIVGVAEGEDGVMQDVIGWRLDDVVELIRGPRGSTVRLEVIPATAKSDAQRKLIRIVRNEVKLEEQSAKSRVLELWQDERTVRVGVITIPTFYIDFEALRRGDPDYRSTTRDVYHLLTELMEEDVEGIIIDLRDNGGGSLQEAHALTGLFIDSGPIVQIRHANARVRREGKARSTPYYDGPLTVLINRLSASASEIFAGALQDYGRALILGSQSFGKGTVQSLTPLRHGQLKLTESKFYRISGKSTQHRGIVPDLELPSLYDHEEIGESALPHALPWDQIAGVPHRRYYDMESHLPYLLTRHQERVERDPDLGFLLEQQELEEGHDEPEWLSLNETERRSQMKEQNQRRLALENRRRVARGLPRLESLEARHSGEEEAAEGEESKPDEIDPAIADPLLTEAASILVDALPMYQRPMMARQ